LLLRAFHAAGWEVFILASVEELRELPVPLGLENHGDLVRGGGGDLVPPSVDEQARRILPFLRVGSEDGREVLGGGPGRGSDEVRGDTVVRLRLARLGSGSVGGKGRKKGESSNRSRGRGDERSPGRSAARGRRGKFEGPDRGEQQREEEELHQKDWNGGEKD